jgi:hypothetical protein
VENVDRNLEEQIQGLCDRTSPALDRRILSDLAGRLPPAQTRRPILMPAGIGRTIMMSKRFKIVAAAVVALAIMLPVSYGTVKAIKKHFTVAEDKVTFEYPGPNGPVSYVYGRSVSVSSSDAASEQEARAHLEEFFRLYQEGKATQIEPGIWRATLSNGEEFAYAGNPAHHQLEFTEEDKTRLKQQTDEMNALRQAGQAERTFWKETEENGVRMRLYHVRYTLSDGRVITVCEGEEIK